MFKVKQKKYQSGYLEEKLCILQRERRINDIKKSISQRMEENGVANLNLDDFIWTPKGAEAVVRAWDY